MKLAADELVGREDRLQRFHHRVAVESQFSKHPLVTERAEHDAFDARHVEGLQALCGDPIEQLAGRFSGGFGLQDDDHVSVSSLANVKKNPPGGRACCR